MVDKNPNHYCGIRALLMLNKWCGYKTAGSLLRMIMEVMAPGVLRPNDVVGGIIRWENRINVLNKAWEETKIPETFKTALVMGMLPKEYQDSVFFQDWH